MVGAHRLASHWWVVLVRGLIGIAFGIFALIYPAATVLAFVVLFAAFAFVDGLFVLVAALRFPHPEGGRWWWMLLQGIAGIAIGVLTYLWPGITLLALALLIAAWAIVTGVLEIGAAFNLRREIAGEILLIIAGVLSILLGLAFAVFPGLGLLFSVYFFAAYALIAGVALVALSFRIRNLRVAP